ncbi:tumor necrosis factor receptor superfamily member 6 isoform X2 [Cheilinus undulatus]|uniref:tumor necrosis factor receptor superfamily member 6 isoform X2 n=1 Tax=Cheilinus undulatus TaxID=241271 RepID=UPI001BD3F64E|nr:tumor necrosis factor receptor superfamily member 6 isoform X2 [Cheilinus undulatus]
MANRNTFSSLYFCCALIFILVSVFAVSSQAECQDGNYTHEDRVCCLCGVGQKLVEHCTGNEEYGKCEPCDSGTYSSHPSSEKNCEPCTDCSHHNENLEVERPCEAASDAKCRCREDHYCVSNDKDICLLCNPCKECGPEGTKDKCSGNNDTVCNEVMPEAYPVRTIVGIIVPICLVITVVALCCFKMRKIRSRLHTITLRRRGHVPDEEMHPLREVPDMDLQPLIPDIAEILGWRDMQAIAMGSGISDNAIETCKRNHPGESEEQTIELLKKWVERESKGAPRKLIEFLRKKGKKAKEEKVMDLLRNASISNNSVDTQTTEVVSGEKGQEDSAEKDRNSEK